MADAVEDYWTGVTSGAFQGGTNHSPRVVLDRATTPPAPPDSASEGKNHDCVTSAHAPESQLHALWWRDFDKTLVSGVFWEAIRVLKSPRVCIRNWNGSEQMDACLDACVIIPNHVHGILVLGRGGFETRLYGNREAWAAGVCFHDNDYVSAEP